ncbi:hypothetical protein [Hyalangium versicolor]|uniref:hypothetical protein n=1 Tax=Hyalangium versicolor TaxID=2861190 RepID=UPI001CCD0DDD|nr:hypothetical protein [Hyalangium versicolor]
MVTVPFLTADQVTFTLAQWEECDAHHHSPVFGCPVCFLFLVEKEPYSEMGMQAVRQILSLDDGDAESLKYVHAMLADISSIPLRVRNHLREPKHEKHGGTA